MSRRYWRSRPRPTSPRGKLSPLMRELRCAFADTISATAEESNRKPVTFDAIADEYRRVESGGDS